MMVRTSAKGEDKGAPDGNAVADGARVTATLWQRMCRVLG
jgi:hypothetical protein